MSEISEDVMRATNVIVTGGSVVQSGDMPSTTHTESETASTQRNAPAWYGNTADHGGHARQTCMSSSLSKKGRRAID